MTREALQKANKMAEILYSRYGAKSVYLYGSLAWGWFGAGSDIDLMVVELDGDYFEAYGELEEIARPTDFDLVREKDAWPSLRDKVLRRGIVLPVDPSEMLASILPPTIENRYRYLAERFGEIINGLAAEEREMKAIGLISDCPNVYGEPLSDITAYGARDYLHKIYIKIEHIFSLTARLIDGMPVPFYEADDIADRKLLEQMGREVKGVRPPMLSQETLAMVEKLRTFRFLFENTLSFKISSDQYIPLLVALPQIRERFELEVKAFLRKIKETNNIND
jgi:predicted nucleotidyltransferase